MQRGTVRRDRRNWYVLFWEKTSDGRRKKRVRLAPVNQNYPDKASVALLAAKIVDPYNRNQIMPESSMSVLKFVEDVYLPFCQRQLRASTYKDYGDIVRVHLKDKGLDKIALRDFKTVHAQRILNKQITTIGHTSKQRIRSFLSGAFNHALREGILSGENPIRAVKVYGNAPRVTMPAYSLGEIEDMVTALQGTSKIVVAVAALTGLRLSELRGLRWSDYDGEALHVTRSVWRTHVNEPKTRESVAPVPVLPILKEVLDRHRNNSADEAYIFSGPRGKPLNLANLARRVIIDKLSEKKLEWKGWHAFRRGLATNLSMLGVSARTVQAILRHSQISTTMRHYIQSPDTESVEAMRKLGDSLLVFGIR